MDTKELRQKILDLAIRGKLVPQDPNDEPASVLLERIRAEKERLIAEGKIKRPKKSKASSAPSHYQQFEPPFEIPDSWEWVKLDEIATSNIGLTYSPKDIVEDGVPVYRSNNIKDNKICLDEIVSVSCHILDKQYLHNGDLLICARNGSRRLVGKNTIIENLEHPTSFGAFMAVCRSCYNPWIKLLLDSAYFNSYLDESNSTAINQITQKMLLNFVLPFPPQKEQSRIIAAFSSTECIIDSVEQRESELKTNITNLKSKILDLAMQGKLVPQDPTDEPAADMLMRINPKAKIITDNPHSWNIPNNWCWTRVKDVFNPMEKAVPSDSEFFYIDVDNRTNTVSPKQIKTEYAPSRASRKTQRGDIVFSMVRPYLRNVAVVPFDGCIASTGFYVLSRSSAIYPPFAFRLALSEFFVSGLNSYMKGDNSPSINKSNMEEFIIPLPPFNEQKRIILKIDDMLSLIDSIKASL